MKFPKFWGPNLGEAKFGPPKFGGEENLGGRAQKFGESKFGSQNSGGVQNLEGIAKKMDPPKSG